MSGDSLFGIINEVAEYKLIRSDWTADFNKLVNEAIQEGFKLYGFPFRGTGVLYQAMIKEKKIR
jgi:hypothetical protein